MTTYQIGDYVKIKQDDSIKFGRIEEIFIENKEKLIRYNEFLLCSMLEEDLKKEYFSENELIQTEEVEKEFYDSIIEKVNVYDYTSYLNMLLNFQSQGKQINIKETFFYRQKYIKDIESFYPELERLLCCNKVLNLKPSELIINCNECQCIFHANCMENSKKCIKCQSELTFLSKKRVNSNKSIANVKTASQPIQTNPINSVGNMNIIHNFSISDEYSNLPDENKSFLIKTIGRIKKISSCLCQKTMTHEEKIRKTAKDQLMNVFLYAFEEKRVLNSNKENEIEENIDINDEKVIKYIKGLSITIESIIYIKNKQKTDQFYKERLKKLVYNLNHPLNEELRRKIISDEITPDKLASMSSEELAPSKLKQSRTEKISKYLREQVIKSGDFLNQEHKGESMLTTDGEVINQIQEENVVTVNNEENIYNKAMIEYESEEEGSKEEKGKENEGVPLKTIVISNSSNTIYNNTSHVIGGCNKFSIEEVKSYFHDEIMMLKPETQQLLFEKRGRRGKELDLVMSDV